MSRGIKRVPIIFPRQPICSRVNLKNCSLCSGSTDCSGSNGFTVLHVNSGFTDWEALEKTIWDSRSSKSNLKLVVNSVELPRELIWAISYSEKNIIHINLDMTRYKYEIDGVDRMMSVSNRCGAYCVVCLQPIIPTITKIYDVLSVLSRLENKGRFNVNLLFAEAVGAIPEKGGWSNLNGSVIPSRWFTKGKTTQEFKDTFLSVLKIYTEPRNININVCYETNDCNGACKIRPRR